MILGDFHVHSNFSDGKLTIAELVDFYGKRGFGVIAITDHLCEEKTFLGKVGAYIGHSLLRNNFQEYLEVLGEEGERAWKQYKMLVLPGFEISKNSISNHRSAHIVAVGITEYVAADPDVTEIARSIRAQGALAIAAHPVPTRKLEKQTLHLWDRREELRKEFDAWEVASGPHLFDEVLHSGLPLIASSDFHHPGHIRAWKTVLDCEKHPEAILDAVKKQNISFRFFSEASLGSPSLRGREIFAGPSFF